jgi:hypothetical protein
MPSDAEMDAVLAAVDAGFDAPPVLAVRSRLSPEF